MGFVHAFFPWPLKTWAIEAALCFGGAPSQFIARGFEALHYDYMSTMRVYQSRSKMALEDHEDLPADKRDPDFLYEHRKRVRLTTNELTIYGG